MERVINTTWITGILTKDVLNEKMPPLYGPLRGSPSSRDLGIGKGSTKNMRKINPKAKKAAEERIKELEREKALAKTKKEKDAIQKRIEHEKKKASKKSEPHGRNSGRH